ncbi:protein-L-isoaspartate(D-aspartate) O-methyltransferase [Chitinimonas sp. BJB300]|uniref:protein-L-isoaspartate(D-aspartate) O-methyltransferase n=1 Tax=Chitinimonas sp. BJB300 TaxID=1559339 RepID=UPI000C0C6F58|nr:protein-L-isoaspartate(D-aspartate) O-methyltransferase [Chitinimonas sp. BJB300]PHV11392.1 protein-L-isoaspartate O-methyltransferase [Chitinimonas sp. BJB300]TSJ89149.1 protein-L-isoaspartate(D-aspartate) O-methyltransferase [Chitinimonas sp. BJB300]
MTSARTRGRLVERLRQQGIRNEEVLAVMGNTPRHIFVDEALSHRAYDDVSLPIGLGQTISQPYIVARMVELAISGARRDKVLEIGGGCGYQTVVLAQLFKTVYSIERIAQLMDRARLRLRELRINNARLKHGDGFIGIAEAAPFDVIVMAAAPAYVPDALLAQLAIGGRMVFPIGTVNQELRIIERTEEGFVDTKLEKVRFVPMLPGLA